MHGGSVTSICSFPKLCEEEYLLLLSPENAFQGISVHLKSYLQTSMAV